MTALAMPRQGLGDVSSHLASFVITTWDVDPNSLAARLPEGLEPDVFTLDDGRERAFVSAVSFTNTDFFVRFAPFVKLTCLQTNYRAYVRRGDERAAWFFATSLGTPWVFIPRHVWGLPWARTSGRQEASWGEAGLERLEWKAEGALGAEALSLRGTGAPVGRLDGFADAAQTHEVLTAPTVGYLYRRGRTPATYSIWHAPLEMERAEASTARFEHYERLGLVEPGAAPHSVLVQRLTHYLIFLPPKRAVGLRWRPPRR
ncbi:MAG: DUF2071 domain-containing protein [Sandaracinaceae bacterium]|nr:DUF2071 domain-containing protein [Sandaracinaceae bacterium]